MQRLYPHDLDFTHAPLYRKVARLRRDQVAMAMGGEVIHTTHADGLVETMNTAQMGDMIISRTATDRYILKPARFAALYVLDPEDSNYYQSCSVGRALVMADDTLWQAPWGADQFIARGGVLFQSAVDGSVYGNQAHSFAADFVAVTTT